MSRELVDELHRRVGRNLLLFQAAEESLRGVLPYAHPEGSRNGVEAMRKYAEDQVSGKPLGLLIEQFNQSVEGDKQLIAQELKAFVDARNQLVHHFYRNPAFDLRTPDGVTAALTYLDDQYRQTCEWAHIFRAQAAGVLLALMDSNPKLAAELEQYREQLLAQVDYAPN